MLRQLSILQNLPTSSGSVIVAVLSQCTRLLSTTSSSSNSSSSPGLFGIKRLQSPGDFPRWAEDAKER
jgi:hypothetical protein